jgi:two-component SAPR family response regulator
MLSEAIIKMVDASIEVLAFEAVREALEYLKGDNKVPNIIFVDINMPYLNGWDFVAEFSKFSSEPRFERTAVNMLTSSDHEKDMEKAQTFEIMSYTSKPLTKDDFTSIYNFYLEQYL